MIVSCRLFNVMNTADNSPQLHIEEYELDLDILSLNVNPCCLQVTETPKNTGKYFTVILISKLMTVVKKIQKEY